MSDVYFKEKSVLSCPLILTTKCYLFISYYKDFFGVSFPLSLTLVLLYSVFLKGTHFHCECITSIAKSHAASKKPLSGIKA